MIVKLMDQCQDQNKKKVIFIDAIQFSDELNTAMYIYIKIIKF